MSKTKMTLAVSGGVIGLAVLTAAFFTWSAYSERTAAAEGDDEEGTDGLETVIAKAESLSRKPVYPCAASLKALESNRTAIVDWQSEALKLAARGDRTFEKTTPAAFKTFLVSDARRLASLPGAVGGVLVKPDFAFGPFKDYISGGKMPDDAQVAEFQRKWDDIATVVEILAQSGIAELTDVQFKAKEEPKDEPKNVRKNKATRGAKQDARNTNAPRFFSYVFSFAAKPAAFVKAINALETCERFVTVDGFTFGRGKDAIAEALGGDEKKAESQAQTGRRGRRGRRGSGDAAPSPLEEKGNDAAKGGLVTDPLLDEPLAVVLNVTVSDFGSLEEKEEKK